MRKIKKIGIVVLILLVTIILTSNLAHAFFGVDDAIVGGIGCAAGAFLSFGGSCYAYNPPETGYDCGVCNEEDPFGKCTEYRCRAIGESCRYVASLDNPAEEGFCADGAGGLYATAPEITKCSILDLSTMRLKQDVTSSGNNCDFGVLSLDKQYAPIFTTNKIGECRLSKTPNNEKLFELPPDQLQNTGIEVLLDFPNGLQHYWPNLYFNSGWTTENIQEFNDANSEWYVRCADFTSGIASNTDYSFTFDVMEGVGDVDGPRILQFYPETKGHSQVFYVKREVQSVDVIFLVSDIDSGVQECRYSDENVGFGQMEPVSNCRVLTEEEREGLSYEGDAIKRCETTLSGIGDGVNDFYFNCKDSSENGNIATTPFEYDVIKIDPLSLEIKTPSEGQVLDGLNDVLYVETSGGIRGIAECRYSYSKTGGGPSGTGLIFESDGEGSEDRSQHRQTLDFFPEDGNYRLEVECNALGDENNIAQGSVNIEYERPGPLDTPDGNQCRIDLLWLDTSGRIINTPIEDGTRVIAAVKDIDCGARDAPINSQNIRLGLFEFDERNQLQDDYEDVTQILNFPSSVRFGDEDVIELPWRARYIEDQGNDGPDPTYVFRTLDYTLESNGLKVIPATGGEVDDDSDDDSDDGDSEDGGSQGDNSGASSLLVGGIGPTGIVRDTNVELFVTLREGPDGSGIASCSYTNQFSRAIEEDYNAAGFQGVMDFEELFGGITKYTTQLSNLDVGEHTYYMKCIDSNQETTALQRVQFEVRIPDSKTLSVVNTKPRGLQGRDTVRLEVETQGGIDDGASVQCTFRTAPDLLVQDLPPSVLDKGKIAGNKYVHKMRLDITDINDGSYNVPVECSDRTGQTASGNIVFEIREDLIKPEIQQIVTRGSVKFITLNEEATCEIATGTNVPSTDAGWTEISRDSNNPSRQLINVADDYYFRCSDAWGNQMDVVRINL